MSGPEGSGLVVEALRRPGSGPFDLAVAPGECPAITGLARTMPIAGLRGAARLRAAP